MAWSSSAKARTDAKAGPQGHEATANALELGDKAPSKEFGGKQSGKGSSKGGLVDTGDNGRPTSTTGPPSPAPRWPV